MLTFLSSQAAAVFAKLGAIGAALFLGRAWGLQAEKAKAAAQEQATQDDIMTRQQAMAQAEADAPRDVAAEEAQLKTGSF